MDIKPQIAVLNDYAATEKTVELIDLARRLNLPLLDAPDENFSHFLTFREARLELHTLKTPKRSPLVVETKFSPRC